MATLLSDTTTDTVGTGQAISGPCTVWLSGEFDGATVVLQGSATDSNYVKLDSSVAANHRFAGKGCVAVDAQGSYYLRAVLENAGSSTSVSVVTT